MSDSNLMTFPVPGHISFPTGHRIDVHEIWHGQVLYQVWPPSVEAQGQFDRLCRMDIADFEAEIEKRGGVQMQKLSKSTTLDAALKLTATLEAALKLLKKVEDALAAPIIDPPCEWGELYQEVSDFLDSVAMESPPRR